MANKRVQATLYSAPDPRRSAGKRKAPRTAALYRTVGKQPVDLMRYLSSLLKNEALKFSTFPDHTFNARFLWSNFTFGKKLKEKKLSSFLKSF